MTCQYRIDIMQNATSDLYRNTEVNISIRSNYFVWIKIDKMIIMDLVMLIWLGRYIQNESNFVLFRVHFHVTPKIVISKLGNNDIL